MDKRRLRAAPLLPSFAHSYALATGKPADCHGTKAPSPPYQRPAPSSTLPFESTFVTSYGVGRALYESSLKESACHLRLVCIFHGCVETKCNAFNFVKHLRE